MFDKLHFGSAGVPHSSKKPDILSGMIQTHALGLDCNEIQFSRNITLNETSACQVYEFTRKQGLAVSVHGSYFINLNAKEKAKQEASKKRILAAARMAHQAGARGQVFHPAFYLKSFPTQVLKIVQSSLKTIASILKKEKNTVLLRTETTGKPVQFGNLDEILTLGKIPGVAPCIDFSHLYARNGKGSVNTYNEFAEVLEKYKTRLGQAALNNMHIHLSGIVYSEKGERYHVNLNECNLKYKALLKALKDFQVKGMLICESPNLEKDALLLKKTYAGL